MTPSLNRPIQRWHQLGSTQGAVAGGVAGSAPKYWLAAGVRCAPAHLLDVERARAA